MTYPEAIDYLFGIRQSGMVLGLEPMLALLDRIGNPQRDLRFVHIAGTNGKGSVAAMCQAALTANGHRTGLYTSPHLVALGERFQTDGRMMTEADLARLVTSLQPAVEAIGVRPLTFFEVVTALALQHYREQQVDVVVWETGLGGRLDATNVVQPLAVVLTSIGLDHTAYLGNTLATIAAEKCGIIKPGRPVVAAAGLPEVQAVVRGTCRERQCPLLEVTGPGRAAPGGAAPVVTGESLDQTGEQHRVRVRGTRRHDGDYDIPLRGRHQAVNCATAIAALEACGLAADPARTRAGLGRTCWPGRFQVVPGRPTLVLDGAHNLQAADLLQQAVQDCFPGRRVNLILGILRDKDYPGLCQALAPLAQCIWCVPVANERTSDPHELAALCSAAHPPSTVMVRGEVMAALGEARTDADAVTVVTGSLFLVAEVLQHLPPPHGWQPPTPREPQLQ